MNMVIGTCGNCGGPVGYFGTWMSVAPQEPQCQRCGAVPDNAFGRTLPMKKRKKLYTDAHRFQDQADEALDAIATRKDAPDAAVSPCPSCGGWGQVPIGTECFVKCHNCNGTGKESK